MTRSINRFLLESRPETRGRKRLTFACLASQRLAEMLQSRPKPKAYKPERNPPMLIAAAAASARKAAESGQAWSQGVAEASTAIPGTRVQAQWADQEQVNNGHRARYWARALVTLGVMFLIVAGSYDLSTRISDRSATAAAARPICCKLPFSVLNRFCDWSDFCR